METADPTRVLAPAKTPGESMPLLHAPGSLRSGALLIIAVLISLAALRYAAVVIVPLVLGVLLSYALTPVINLLVRLHLPRALAAALLMASIVGGMGTVAYSLKDDTVALIETLPEVAQKLRRAFDLQTEQGSIGTIDKVQRVASELERTAQESNEDPEPDRDVAKVQIEKPKFNVMDYLLPGTLSLAAVAGEAIVVLFVAFFLLAAGNNFRRKMVRLAGPTLTEKKFTVQALDEIGAQIQRYLQVQIFTSALVGTATWLAFEWIGMEHAAVWGILTFVLNFIPYLGSIIASGAAMLFGFAQFSSIEMALLIGGVTLGINSVEGYMLTPWLTSRASRMNPVAVFAGVLAWGWLWGVWGLFLGVPILMVIKVVCDRVDEFKPLGELLGE
ncbi:MAG: AI-2E family transporter [Xanthomonadales bacterium]|nr:AI-2E family transporter [Xanthomonadales bacterium]